MLTTAIVLITTALALYTTGVWTERRDGTLGVRHAVLFGLGLLADASGTLVMSRLAASGDGAGVAPGPVGALNDLMAVTGSAALALMALHLTWAVVVLARGRVREKAAFHRFSVAVWAVWLVPYAAGAAAAMV